MVDENDFILKKYISKEKTRNQKWFMHYCDVCKEKRSYAPKNKTGLCSSCACKGRTISQNQKDNISNTLRGNKNAANITPKKIIERTAKRMGISIEQYIVETSIRKTQRKIRKNMMDRLSRFLRGKRKSVEYLPFSREKLMTHLASKFQPGMTWENYGRFVGRKSWEIDHVIPLRYKENNVFYWDQNELSDHTSSVFKKAWALENLQPKWDHENWSKGAHFKE